MTRESLKFIAISKIEGEIWPLSIYYSEVSGYFYKLKEFGGKYYSPLNYSLIWRKNL